MARREARLDQALVQRGLAPSRAQAQGLILAGRVTRNGEPADKPGIRVGVEDDLRVLPGPRYVGRGGFKLAGALDSFGVSVDGRDALDVGASTGGFTQVLLERGARRVVALDVGRGQLDWNLRRDPRVHVLEGVNARHLAPENLPFPPCLAVVDVSFISLALVLPPVVACLRPAGDLLALVKPQFEVGRREVGKGGLVTSSDKHAAVLEKLTAAARGRGWGVAGVAASVLPGARGNREFFLHILPDRPGLDPASLATAIRGALVPARRSEP